MEFIRSDELLFEGKGWVAIHKETEEATLEGYGTEDNMESMTMNQKLFFSK